MNKKVSISGFMIPLDYSKKQIKEFLLVPYMPSCNHVPPPPANMIINVKVKSKKGLKPSYYPIKVVGELKLEKPKGSSDPYMPEGVYTISTDDLEELKN